ncbi:MAG: LPXTG cell wall anchor domain-containing protein [Acidimicrobiales bacterium]
MVVRRVLVLVVSLVVLALAWAGSASPAGAAENPDYTVPPPTTPVTSPPPTSAVKTAVKVAPVRTRLAITGSDTTTAAVVGLTCVGAGAGLLVVRRRRLAA